ncbi:MAG: four-carbon acid sugar kinase family protein, partial [Planctomycetales bacterium]|nr:four-carbon acid sugar kinase family protein [Planctomycetales bacterium]
ETDRRGSPVTISNPPGLRLAYYADDFTGATDALERLELAGVRTTLFLRPPSLDQIGSRPEVEAVGVAGATRSLATADLPSEVLPALAALKNLGAPHVHYKVCSTFDSSPQVGSIGRVIELADELFDTPFVPVVVGAPALGRWCVFGNLFASMGIGAESPAYRLDRHPSMSQHPITPTDEADLTRPLARQTSLPISLIDVRTLDKPLFEAVEGLRMQLRREQPRIVLFDSLTDAHLAAISALVSHYASGKKPVFWVGSSAVESALAAHWQAEGEVYPRPNLDRFKPNGPVLVLAGSCSPVTAGQVNAALQAGVQGITLTNGQITTGADGLDHACQSMVVALRASRSVILATEPKTSGAILPPEALGRAFSQLCLRAVEQARPALVVIAGGDTSSHTARSLPIESLEFNEPLTPGAPVCRVVAAGSALDGLRVVFKGGQVGRPEFLVDLCLQKEDAA